MIRESRYIVMKQKDIAKYLSPLERESLSRLLLKISEGRHKDNKKHLRCVCIESDWEIYEPVWSLVELQVELDQEKS